MSNTMGDAARHAQDNAESTAQRVSDNVWFDRGVRVGLVGYGIIHILIGWLALQLAFGDSSGSLDQQGALTQIAQQPFGTPLLWIVGLGLFLMAIWQIFEAMFGYQSRDQPKRTVKRVGSAGKVVIYTVLGVSAINTALGSSSGGSSGTDRFTAKVMDLPGGQLLVGAIGVGIIVVAFMLAKRGFTKSFEKDLKGGATTGTSGTAVERLGQVGYIAKGVATAVVGGLFVWAAVDYDPDKAGGLDVALRKLLDENFGPWLLAVVAVGIACFGLYCFAWARYADTSS